MKHGLERFSRTFVCAVFCLASIVATATPMVSNLKVTSVEPLGLAIDFNVSGATADDAALLEVSLTADGIIYNAQNLVGATNCVDGAHRVYWNMAKDGIAIDPATASLMVTYVYPLYCVIDLSGGSKTNSYPVAYMNEPPGGGFNTTEYKTAKLVLKRVDSGSFKMQNSTTVTLTKPFYMGLYEVTQRQWELVTGSNPCSSTSYGKGDAYPVHYVSYDMIRGSSSGAKWPTSNAVDSSSFLGKLRKKIGNLPFDLPTEAQWEYACRAGTTTTYSYGDSADGAYMWYSSNSFNGTHEVGTKLPNKWGFYDMHGNVGEWCLDWYGTLSYGTDPRGSSSGSDRVRRGGSWNGNAFLCTSSNRDYYYPSYNTGNLGFRLSRTLAEAEAATVEFALGRICADGSSIDGKVSLGYAPTESLNAVVAINDEMLLNASEAGSWTWYAPAAGTYAVSHTVGTDTLAAAYVVTNGYAKVEIGGGLVRCCNASGCDSLVVTVNVDVATVPWTAEISEEARDSWVFLMSGEDPVLGDGTFELRIAPAAEGVALPRTATVAVGNATLRITQDNGVVIDGGNVPFIIPATWFAKYPALGGTTVAEWQKIAEGAGVKIDASGAAQPVWHDYVAGTDPTDAASRFTASVALEDGKPVVTWTPALNGEGVREGVRIYRVWGKADLGDAAWSEVAPGGEADYRFFRVTVEMP